MIIEGRYLDEILRPLYGELLSSTDTFQASKGKGQDLLAPTIILKNPRARISSTAARGRLVSALGEFCWYMTGSADLTFIRHYIPSYPPKDAIGSIPEAYGPRLLGTGEFGHVHDQIKRVIERLSTKPDSRRATIAIITPADLQPDQNEAPCTVALQFITRRERLHMIAMMRSNDAHLGFPHDLFSFTMIQELVARSLKLKLGDYHHFATSLHLYEPDIPATKQYLSEGYQNPTFAMPAMPAGCQRQNLNDFLCVEEKIRNRVIASAAEISLPTYWKDLALVLLRHSDKKNDRNAAEIEANFSHISSTFFENFFLERPQVLLRPAPQLMNQGIFDLDDGSDAH